MDLCATAIPGEAALRELYALLDLTLEEAEQPTVDAVTVT